MINFNDSCLYVSHLHNVTPGFMKENKLEGLLPGKGFYPGIDVLNKELSRTLKSSSRNSDLFAREKTRSTPQSGSGLVSEKSSWHQGHLVWRVLSLGLRQDPGFDLRYDACQGGAQLRPCVGQWRF